MTQPLGKVLQFKRKNSEDEKPAVSVTFKDFAQAVMEGDLTLAVGSLGQLFGVSPQLAHSCATAFHRKAQNDPEILSKLMLLRDYLENGEMTQTLVVLNELFEVSGPESVMILTNLTAKFGKTNLK